MTSQTPDDLARNDPARADLPHLAAEVRCQRWAQRQLPRRASEEAVRRNAAALCFELLAAGFSCPRIARRMGLAPRTLSHWRCRLRLQQPLARLRGRPPKQSSFKDRHEVLEVIQEVGVHVGLPTLRAAFPNIPRGELIDLQGAYRHWYRARHRQSVETLHWTTPGRVWAMDHTEPPGVIDGQYPDVLAVRDLASGMQLAWLPVAGQTAESTARELEILFLCFGPPLVLKSDNGSAFISHLLYALLAQWQVVPLFSPAQMPQYNGACEAGIGAMKNRTDMLAACLGHTLAGSRVLWSGDHLEAARHQANEFHRPWGHRGPTRRELWDARQPITAEERAAFAATLARCRQEATDTLGSLARGNARPGEAPDHGSPSHAAPPAHGNAPRPAPVAHGNLPDAGAAGAAHGNPPTVDADLPACQANRHTVPPAEHALNRHSPLHGSSPEALIHRRAVRHALLEQGLLSITRRSITLPIRRLKSANIP